MNSVKLIGNVGRDVNVKDFETGRLVTFSLATNETFTNRHKEEVKTTCWHSIAVWGQLAHKCESFLEKGKMIQVEGRLNYRQYQNKEDQLVRTVEIVAIRVEEFVKQAEPVA